MNNLIDDISFEVLRTNPKLSTNVKLMVSDNGLFLSTFSADENLDKSSLKDVRISGDGLYNKDVYNFYRINKVEKASAYKVFAGESTLVMHDDFKKQYEMMYSVGAEYINSKVYSEEFGILAPLWLNKKLPHYFIVFKVANPAFSNLADSDIDDINDRTTFTTDVLANCEIIKVFDLSEKTKIGSYINRYTQQEDFPQAPLYASFDRHIPSRYYGFSYDNGTLMYAEESNANNMLNIDRTQLDFDKFITDGFERNGIVCANLMNIEFLFNDETSSEYTINRYFGMYCDTLDFDLDTQTPNFQSIYAVDDVFGGLHSVNALDQSDVASKLDKYSVYDTTNVYNINAVPMKETNVYAQLKLDANDIEEGVGYTFYMKNINSADTELGSVIPYDPTKDCISRSPFDFQISKIDVNVTARNFAQALNNICTLFKAYAVDNYVYLIATAYGPRFNDLYMVRDIKDNETSPMVKCFKGGIVSSYKGSVFKTEKIEKIEKLSRTAHNEYVAVSDILEYTIEPIFDNNGKFLGFNDIDKYSIVVFDKPNVQCKYNQISLYDRFDSSLKVLSFYPIKDFDFSTHSTMYSKSVYYDNKGIDGNYNGDGISDSDVSDSNVSDSDSDYTDIMSIKEVTKLRNNFYVKMGGFPYLSSELTQSAINTEYDRLNENYIYKDGFCNASKVIPYINKWSYFDDGLDARHNPYRLNVNLAFGVNNFSPNPNVQLDQNAFTHEWYYIYDSTYNKALDFNKLLQDETHDYFTDFFLNDTIYFSNKHDGKKYSRFHFGSQSSYAETMFNGVRIVAKNKQNGNTYYSDELNGYRFSVILNITENITDNPICVVKNDTFKFIVIVVTMNFTTVITTENLSPDTIYGYEYYKKKKGKLNLPISGKLVGFDIVDISSHTYKIYGKDTLFTNELMSQTNVNEQYNLLDSKKNNIAKVIDVIDDKTVIVELCDYVDDDGVVRMRDLYDLMGKAYVNGNGVAVYVDKIKRFSFSEIVSTINRNNAYYLNDDLSLLIEPQQTYQKMSYLNAPYVTNLFGINIGCELVATEPTMYIIHRHSGYYAPMAYDVVIFSDTYTNTIFDTQCENFGLIKDLYYHKVKLNLDGVLLGNGEQYPLIGICGIDKKDHYVFNSNWDRGYFNGYISGVRYPIYGTRSMKEKKSFMGSKLANVPNTIDIDVFSQDAYSIAVNNSKVNVSLGVDEQFMRYMYAKLYDVFDMSVDSSESMGDTNTIDDDIYYYIKENLMPLYMVSDIRMQIKYEYESDTNIDTLYMDKDTKARLDDGMKFERSFDVKSTPNTFDKLISFTPRKGYRTYISFVVSFKKI